MINNFDVVTSSFRYSGSVFLHERMIHMYIETQKYKSHNDNIMKSYDIIRMSL